MSDINSVVLIGRLTRDAQLKYTANGTALSKFSLAVNEKRKVGEQWKEEVSFFDIQIWGQLGESLDQYLKKGKQISVIGKLTQERWDQDGQSRSKVSVTASTVQLLGGPSDNRNEASSNQSSPPASGMKPGYMTPTKGQSQSDDGFTDDILF